MRGARWRWPWCGALVWGALLALRVDAADGNELYGIGAISKGLGGAGVASPRDATWALLNPAALVDLERRADLSLELLYNRVGAEPRGAAIAANPWAGRLRTENLVPIPEFGVVWPWGRGAIGAGVFGIQGNMVEYARPRTTLSLLTNSDRRSQYEIAKIPLAYGHRFDNGWAVGAAVVGAFTRFRTDSITTNFVPTRGDNRWDVALGAGLVFGMYRRWDAWSVGAAYTSRTWVDDFDRYEADLLRWNFDLPQKVQVGVAFRPAARVEALLDYKWMDWSQVKLLSNATTHGGLGWRNSHIVKAGLEYRVNDRWTLRGGVSYGKAPVRAEYAFANAITPAISEWHLGAGVSYRVNARRELHIALSYGFPESMTDTGRGDIYSFLGRGTRIRYQENAVTVQYSLAF